MDKYCLENINNVWFLANGEGVKKYAKFVCTAIYIFILLEYLLIKYYVIKNDVIL